MTKTLLRISVARLRTTDGSRQAAEPWAFERRRFRFRLSGWPEVLGVTGGEREGAMAEVKIVTPRGEMPTYVAMPSGEGPAGRCRHPRLRRDEPGPAPPGRLAGQPGLPGRRPDLYWWGSMLRCLRTIMRELGTRQGRTFDDIEAARGWLAGHDQHRSDRGDRLLHGRRVCAGAGPRPRVRGVPPTTAAAPATPNRSRPAPARSSAAMAARTARRWATEPLAGWSGPLRRSGWTMTSRSIPTPATGSSTTTLPPTERPC